MELAALGRLSGAGPVVSGADVKLPLATPSGFHRALKDSPIVAGYVPLAATVTAFRETMARTLTIIVSAFVAFATHRRLRDRRCDRSRRPVGAGP